MSNAHQTKHPFSAPSFGQLNPSLSNPGSYLLSRLDSSSSHPGQVAAAAPALQQNGSQNDQPDTATLRYGDYGDYGDCGDYGDYGFDC